MAFLFSNWLRRRGQKKIGCSVQMKLRLSVMSNLLYFSYLCAKKNHHSEFYSTVESYLKIFLMFISLNLKISSHSFKTKSNNGVGNISLKVSFFKSLAFGLTANIQNLKVVSSGELR